MTYDVITFNGEDELFEIRYNILKDYVDEFRVIEFDKTFSGKPKSPTFNQNWPKVKSYYITEEIWSKYEDLAKSSPNTQYGKGASHWTREFCQKESIKDCLIDLKDNDIVYIGDCDEIWDPEVVIHHPAKIKLIVYSYWLNNRSSEDFWGTMVNCWGQIKNECLNHLRTNTPKTIEAGWHFTSMGGYDKIKNKLTDSYTPESYAHPYILDSLENNLYEIRDFLGRNFSYSKDDSEWPSYLKDNSAKYAHLLR